jgi:membrane-associated phospholipid phosphatase
MVNEPIVSASSGSESLPDRRSLAAAIVILVMGIAIIAVASDAFFDFATQLKANNPLIRHLDQGVHDWCVTHRNGAGNTFFVIVTTLGSPLILSVATSIVVIVKWRKHQRGTALFLALATAGGYGIQLALKQHYARARPLLTQAVQGAHGYSFPSGHATGSAIVLGAFAYLIIRGKHELHVKVLSVILAGLLLVAVCWSRVYIGVHWLTDVIAGAGLGAVWLLAAILAQEIGRWTRRLRGHRLTR